jgi:hypothetical protein
MKNKNIQATKTITGIIVVLFILICGNANAQYGPPPWARPPNRTIIVQRRPVQENRPVQDYRQDYNRYNRYDNNDQPYISFSIHFDPLLSWFSTDSYDTRSDGVVPGFVFGVSYNKYFSPNYSFSSGLNIIRSGGILVNRDVSQFEFKDYYSTVYTIPAGEPITYRITYLSVPLGLKLQTNQTGYGRFFTDVGFDPKVVIGGRADIPSVNIKDGNATRELNPFNLAFHVVAGMEYPLAGNNYLVVGLGYETNLFDVTRDNGDQPTNVVLQKMVSLRLGITF